MDLTASIRVQAEACSALGSPMYAELLHAVADDVASGGPAAEVLTGHEGAPGPSAVALRLLGSVHRLVLQRRAGLLAAYYPSVGGAWEATAGWAAFRALLVEHPEAVAEWLDRPPQTNEPGRAAALVGGLLALPAQLPVRLFEIGSSAGLNLLADRFHYTHTSGATWGEPDSPVRLEGAWTGRDVTTAAPALQIASRVGSDLRPVDATTTEGRLTLTAYVWADQASRLERLRGALALAARHPLDLRAQSAAAFVDEVNLADGCLTVVWHSVMWQYLSREEQQRIMTRLALLGERATSRAPLAHLRLEPERRGPEGDHEFLITLTTWPDGRTRVLGTSRAHGLPTTWQ